MPTKPWTKEEEEVLRREYKKISARKLSQQLNRSEQAIYRKWRSLNTPKTKEVKPWTAKEEQLLEQKYTEYGPDKLSTILGRSTKSIINKAHRIGGIRRQDSRKEWTTSEVERLLLYKDQGLSTIECAKRLGRSENSTQLKCANLGLTEKQGTDWTEAEEQWLKENCRLPLVDIQEGLQRSRMSIIRKRQSLGLPTRDESYYGLDGKRYDSKQEKQVANILHREQMAYRSSTEVPKFQYGDGSWFRPDFIVKQNIVVEYFGLYGGPYPDYQCRIDKKIAHFQNNKKYKFVALYPSDLRRGTILKKIKEVM